MTLSTYPDLPIDRERLIEVVRTLQVDLHLLAEWLARESTPVLHEHVLWNLMIASEDLQRSTPARRQ